MEDLTYKAYVTDSMRSLLNGLGGVDNPRWMDTWREITGANQRYRDTTTAKDIEDRLVSAGAIVFE
jgi:hypothetical protein